MKDNALSTPCLRSHDLSRFIQPKAGLGGSSAVDKGLVTADGEIFRLVQQLPTLCREDADCGSAFRLIVPSDVDLNSACLDPSWFVNIVVTLTDRNGSVIYHEAHFPRNPSLRDGIKNFVDVRWGDYVHEPDADIWNQHLIEAFAEADRWRSVRLSVSHSPPASENGAGQHRRRRVSSGGVPQPQQQVVSTTSRLSPDIAEAAMEEALQRRFVVCPIYRARWGGSGDVFYFKTISLPFLRNQGDGCAEEKSMTSLNNETTNVFSPTSSFENLLLLNYHCILGKASGDAISGPPASDDDQIFDAVTLRVGEKATGFSSGPPYPLAGFKPTLPHQQSTDTNPPVSLFSSTEHSSPTFCFETMNRNEICEDNFASSTPHHSRLPPLTRCYDHADQSDPYVFVDPPKTPCCEGRQQIYPCSTAGHVTPGARTSYSSAHLAPVDIDWIDQSQPIEYHECAPLNQNPHLQYSHPRQHFNQRTQQQNYSGMSPILSPVIRSRDSSVLPPHDLQMQKEDSTTTGYHSQLQQQRFRQRPNVSESTHASSSPPAFNQATSQHDRISIFLSLLLPEAIREIKEAVSAEPDMVAQRVRAIVTRHLGPEILSKFFSNQLTTSSSSSSSSHLTRSSSDSLDSRCCQHLAEKFQQQPSHPPAPSLLKESPTGPAPVSTALQQQPHKRPSLVQELSVTSDGGPPPTPLLYNSHASKKDHPLAGSVVYGTKQRLGCCQQSHHQPLSTLTASSAQTSGTTTPTSFDSMASSSPWIAVGRQPPPARKHTISVSSASSSQEIHSTAGVLESLLMGGDVQDVRFKRTSGSNCCGRQRNSSEVMMGSRSTEFRQTLSNSGPSSACCQAPKLGSFALFGLENEEWPGVTPSSPNGLRAANPSSAASQVLMSPNSSSSSCSSLAHLLRHGCPLAPAASFNGSSATSVASTASSETLTSLAPSVPTACSVRANRLAVAVPSTSSLTPTSTTDEKSTSRPLDRPLSVIVDPQMNLTKPAHPLQHYDVGQQSSVSPKSLNSLQSKLPPPPHPKEALLAQENSQVQFQSTTARETNRKPNVRDTSEDEDAALANSSLCRLLQGPDPRWETVTAEVESAAQEDAPPPPPPPPPSFFEIPPAILAGGEGEPKRVRYDSCPLTKKEPMSVPSPSPQVDVPRALTGCTGGRTDSAKPHRASSSSAPPSAIHTVEAPISSPSTYERNRQAAAVAAARIAEEAANQSKQLPSSRHLFERQRLLYQQNVGQVTAYHSTSHHHLNNMHQRSYAYGNRGSDQSSGTALVQCAKNTFHDYAPSATTSVPSQRPPLEDFSRRMKEVAPNVRVSPTVYHPPNSTLYGDHQMAHVPPAHDYSGGHLAPVSYEYQEPVPTPPSPHADHQRPPTLTPSHYENPQLASPYHQPQKPPHCAARLPSIQPKMANHPQSQSHQRKPRLSRLSSPQSPHLSDTCAYPPEGSYISQSFEQKHLHCSSPVSQSLQQQPPYSNKVKAGLREKVTSRCQARNTNTMTVGLHTGSTPASQSPPLMAAGQKRPIPSASHIYHPHHQPGEQQICYPGPLPLESYRCYGQPTATSASIPEPQQQFAQYPIRSAGLAESPIFDPEFASSGGGGSEDIQLTADIVNDVLELEALL